MATIQIASTHTAIHVKSTSQALHFTSRPCGLLMNNSPRSSTSISLGAKSPSGLPHLPILKSRKHRHVCLASGRRMMENNEDSQWKSLENAMEKYRIQSIEDLLEQQIRKGEYYKNGGSGIKPPGGRGGGGGGGGGPDGSEDGGFAGMSDETVQICLATIGFIFVYMCVINGVEHAKLARDVIRYLFGGGQSPRLKRTVYQWIRFYKNITGSKGVDKDGLEPQDGGTTRITKMSL